MGFWSNVGQAAGSGLASGAGNALGVGLSHKLHGNDVARAGHRLDNKYYLRRMKKSWTFAKSIGLTPQEFFGSGASNPGGPSGAGQVLGNMANQSGQATAAAVQAELDRQTDLEKTRIQTDAQKDVAKIQTGQQQRDLDQRIKEYTEVTLPKAAAELKVRAADLAVRINEIATSDKSFVKWKLLNQMGTENMRATSIMYKHGLEDLSLDTVNELSEQEYKALMAELLAAGSVVNREVKGAKGVLEEAIRFLIKNTVKVKEYDHPTLGNQRKEYDHPQSKEAHENMNQW